jgi:hypothetical protein
MPRTARRCSSFKPTDPARLPLFADVAGRYTLTLELGTGQTVYFSDRPDRIVGTHSTLQFLEGLEFVPDDPPNAALVVETSPGGTDVAVVELFAPTYDLVSQSVSYEIEVLANWQDELEVGFHEAPTDLAALVPSFGAAHLFIDDCPSKPMFCVPKECPFRQVEDRSGYPIGAGQCGNYGQIPDLEHDGFCYSWGSAVCLPCFPWFGDCDGAFSYWSNWCNRRYPACQGNCKPFNITTYQPFGGCGEHRRH